jgi:hypothetical protein
MDSPFPEAVRREFAFLVSEYGFELSDASSEVVTFESPRVEVTASCYPSEHQVDVVARLAGTDDPHAQFVWSGMVGRASEARLVELAAEVFRKNGAALRGDESYYREIATEQQRLAEAWTAYYEGRGPQPTGKLP